MFDSDNMKYLKSAPLSGDNVLQEFSVVVSGKTPQLDLMREVGGVVPQQFLVGMEDTSIRQASN